MALIATSHRREVELEDLCGLVAPAAIERLRELELRLAIEPYEVEDPARHACVLEQHPSAGERVRHGQLVTLLVGQHTSPGAATELPLSAHGAAPAVDREPELAQRATGTVKEPPSAMSASAAGGEDESESRAVVEEPELVVTPAGWQPDPDDQTPLSPSAGPVRGGEVASRRRRRCVPVLAVVLVGLAGLSLLAGQRRAAGSHAVARAVSPVRSETSRTSTTSAATSATSPPAPPAAARAAEPRPPLRRRTEEHHPAHRAGLSAPRVAAARAGTPAPAPGAPVVAAPESPTPAPAATTPPHAATPPAAQAPAAAPAPAAAAGSAGSRTVVFPPSPTGPLGGPYPNQ